VNNMNLIEAHKGDNESGGKPQCVSPGRILNPESLLGQEAAFRGLVESIYIDPSGRSEPIFDGVINVNLYCSSPLRVMWILKEPGDEENSTGGGWSLCSDALAVKPVAALGQATFHPIIYIAYGLFHGPMSFADMPWVRDMENPEDVIRRLAFINAKKLPGVTWGASSPLILEWYCRGKQIILGQINAYCPDVVFGCAPHFPAILDDLDCGWRSRVRAAGSARYVWHGDVLFIQVYHPGQTQISREKYVDDALNAVWQARCEKKAEYGTEHGHEAIQV
jgi:hypothetical protein